MGEAKRRKLLDPTFGKTRRKVLAPNVETTFLPTTVPQDYKKSSLFKPCFGYYYCVHFKDDNPAFFDTNKYGITLVKDQKFITFSFPIFCDSYYLVTVEVKTKSNLGITLMKTIQDPTEPRLRFLGRPNVKDTYQDQNGLKVLPFKLLSLNSEEEYHKECDRLNRQARHFFV